MRFYPRLFILVMTFAITLTFFLFFVITAIVNSKKEFSIGQATESAQGGGTTAVAPVVVRGNIKLYVVPINTIAGETVTVWVNGSEEPTAPPINNTAFGSLIFSGILGCFVGTGFYAFAQRRHRVRLNTNGY